MTATAERNNPQVSFTNSVLFTFSGVTAKQRAKIEELILAYPTIVAERSSWIVRPSTKRGTYEFLAVIKSPRQFEGHERHTLRAKIVQLVRNVVISVW